MKTRKVLAIWAALCCLASASAQTQIIAHRGYWDKFGSAQNSLSSLENAIRFGAYGSELDVWITSDGVVVLNHDDTYQGVEIQTSTYRELAALRLANGEPVPTLQQYIDLARQQKQTRLVVEIKTHRTAEADRLAVRETVKLIDQGGVAPIVDYISFSEHACRELIRLNPAHRVAYLNGEKSPQQLKAEGYWGLDYPWSVLKETQPGWIAEAQSLGLTTNVWTVNDAERMQYFIAQGIDYITTDNPQLLQGILESCGQGGKQPVDYVDPFIGTGFHGHTYPGATLPFGAVQLSPDTRRGNWDAASGYHYSDSAILGFSHTHLSGTGCIDLGDVLIRPATRPLDPDGGNTVAPLPFSHRDETASAGYYAVAFPQEGVRAELTATTYAGVHRYTFDKGKQQNILIDLRHLLDAEQIDRLSIRQTAANEISGMRRTQGWTPNQAVFFAAQFSEPFETARLTDSAAVLSFGISEGRPVVVKVGLSIVSEAKARENLLHDVPGFDFDAVRRQARQAWNEALSDITVESHSEADLKNFYTARYHTKVVPNIVSDADEPKRYSTFSLWDTYRAWNPLMTLTDHRLVNDMIQSFLAIYDKEGELPIWYLSAGETRCMIGYHAVAVIADAYLKGIRGFDAGKALEAMKTSSNINEKGSRLYVAQGFIPSDTQGESVSCLLEYAYDDWCIAQMAQAMGREADYEAYTRRALNYVHAFDGHTRFFRGRRTDGSWDAFEPFKPGSAYTEATPWQYRFYVPHDIHGLIQLFGGRAAFAQQLDSLFTLEARIEGELNDLTGLIGQYVHGNEPSHHISALYNYVGQPWKTQAMTRRILAEMYQPTPEGVVGNEDCGQMSAWYILNSLGFYPVCPGSGQWLLTTPRFPQATLRLANGRTLEIRANHPETNTYIEKVTLNGREITANYLTHEQLSEGGVLVFTLCAEPNLRRGTADEALPYSLSKGLKASVPYTSHDVSLFVDRTALDLASATPGATVRYTLDGTEPTASSTRYTAPLRLRASQTIRAKAFKDGYEPSHTLTLDARKAVFAKPVAAEGRTQGVNYRYYEGNFRSVDELAAARPLGEGTLPAPSIDGARRDDHFAFAFTGIIAVPEDGVYAFMTRSDDGSVLYIDDQKVVSNDGSHAAFTVTGRVALRRGWHTFGLLYMEDYEGQELSWGWKRPSATEFEPIPADVLYLK